MRSTEAHGPSDVREEAVPVEVIPGTPPVVGRTPAQEGGSSSSGGAGPVTDRLSPVGGTVSPVPLSRIPSGPGTSPTIPMQLDRDSRRRGTEDQFGDIGEEMSSVAGSYAKKRWLQWRLLRVHRRGVRRIKGSDTGRRGPLYLSRLGRWRIRRSLWISREVRR